jgi:hypothetical protein
LICFYHHEKGGLIAAFFVVVKVCLAAITVGQKNEARKRHLGLMLFKSRKKTAAGWPPGYG